MKKSTLISVRIPQNLYLDCIAVSKKHKYLNISNLIKLGLLEMVNIYGVGYESNTPNK